MASGRDYRRSRGVCRSVNEIICHGIPDLRPLQDGDIVNGKDEESAQCHLSSLMDLSSRYQYIQAWLS